MLTAALALLLSGCALEPLETPDFTFAVLDVGQGLSQIGVRDGRCIVWDLGDSTGYDRWIDGYGRLGRPSIGAIVVSHTDLDHCGGLARLSEAIVFSGQTVVSPYADTALLRKRAGPWGRRIRFRSMLAGDTLTGLDDVTMECLWPPDSARLKSLGVGLAETNRLSLCFRLSHAGNTVLITGDIDTLPMREMARAKGFGLASDAVVVPHHGSRYSLDAEFYGYVNPATAVVSCGAGNTYGHPSPEVMRFLAFQSGVEVLVTMTSGHIVGRANGSYWSWNTGSATAPPTSGMHPDPSPAYF